MNGAENEIIDLNEEEFLRKAEIAIFETHYPRN